ncbi:MAG: thermonuclease family protein [Halopseudomonas sp.]
MQFFRKALITSAFLFSSVTLANNCPPPTKPQSVDIAKVYDGDTLRLTDGRKVRLIGINTPELGRDGQPDQPLAAEATSFARQLVAGKNPVLLQIGQQSHDHYGRLLGHVFLRDGRNLEAQLLQQGLGFAISIPPNLALRDCLKQAESQAQQAKRGVWSITDYQPLHASSLTRSHSGFGRYTGEISRLGSNSKGNYLELNEKIYVPIKQGVLEKLAIISSDNLLGRKVEVRGWLIARKLTKSQRNRGFLPFMLNINHYDSLILCHSDC